MLKNIFGSLSKDIGIDLGTSNSIFYVKDKGIVINEPSIVAINTRSDQLVAVGVDAKKMMGKTPPHISVVGPIVNGVISDFEVSEKLIKHCIEKIHRGSFTIAPRPRTIVSIPLDITEVERKAVQDAITNAGAREVHLIDEPVATAIGARLNLQDSYGRMVVEIGGGNTSIAVISLSGIVSYNSLKTAGHEFDSAIQDYIRENFNITIGSKSAEEIKIKIGSVVASDEAHEMKVKGRNMLTGLPKEFEITDEQIREAIKRPVGVIVDAVRTTVENAPAELIGDLYESGILLSGGGALLKGFDSLISKELQMPVHVVDDPLTTVVRGTGILLDDSNLLREVESIGSMVLSS
ncbi:rod shape-determining protein [bacterium]|jgi:rod shape-determining protein MreB|nr:rod shape-determining protein [bacterium]MDP6571497.1 rod shape-determining protein [Patescibacteria group bacterium]MDP6756182.1 rod shape-determining protein [Patescibacteria group bacterium]|tara:strand:- start:30913 stop:31962 length:1050 start_codon:yes stop_codon:yes gene_type:complete